jgi:hypothetical protein
MMTAKELKNMTIKQGMWLALQSLLPPPRSLEEYEERLLDQLRQVRKFLRRPKQSDVLH